MSEEVKPKVEEVEPSTDDIFEELEQEEIEELNKIAEETAKEVQKRKEELQQFAQQVTLAEIVECMEKIKKFIELYKEAVRTSEYLRDLFADEKEDPSKAFIRMFMGRGF